ncbi:MAG TPA: 4Fe-4S dicluster domain-containing protein [Pyrinomonadaceae bacterium]|jgi:Fe-S-cluster-containing dehydrogenase component/formate-dependent nitrite reductase membrane component NrfD
MRELPVYETRVPQLQWAKVIDHTRCIGCHACTTACKSENEVPLSVTRTYVKHVDVGEFPQTRRAHQVTRCNQCAHAPCVTACPTSAMFKRADGIVDFDKSICIGCKACMAACPYDAIFINPEDHSAEKCNFCAHRIDQGLEPACVVVCPTEAILVGDMNDPQSKVAEIVNREPVNVRRPEKETLPKLFYKGAHQATLDPLAARRPPGGLYMWSEQKEDRETVASGNPLYQNSSAAALLSYDVPHAIPWDWRVSLYTWTKGISSGAYLVSILLLAFQLMYGLTEAVPGSPQEMLDWPLAASPFWLWSTPVISGVFLAVTGGLLIWDLEHPTRFYMIFTRPQWRSWLVRGAFIIAGYSLVLALHFLASLLGDTRTQLLLILPGVPLAILTAVYTAYLFAQAKARDMWQNPLLPPHLLVQSLLAGSAALLPLAAWLEPRLVQRLLWILGAMSLLHILMVLGEITLTHPTTHARLAVWQMTRGRYRVFFGLGLFMALVSIFAPWLGLAAAPLALAGLLFYEHAYVQAGQSVPLA